MYFPRLRNMDSNGVIGGGNLMQVDEAQFFSDAAATNALLGPSNDIRAIDNPGSDSSYPTTERPLEAIDGIRTSSSKYLNFARDGSGLIIKPGSGPSIARSFQMYAPNDTEGRDPTLYQIYGTIHL